MCERHLRPLITVLVALALGDGVPPPAARVDLDQGLIARDDSTGGDQAA